LNGKLGRIKLALYFFFVLFTGKDKREISSEDLAKDKADAQKALKGNNGRQTV
jgi:hypothetical protein